MDTRGATLLAFLLEHTFQVDAISDQSVLEEAMEAALPAFTDDVGRRPHARRPELVPLAEQLLADGRVTHEVVAALIGQGVSEATAYRMIKRARGGTQRAR